MSQSAAICIAVYGKILTGCTPCVFLVVALLCGDFTGKAFLTIGINTIQSLTTIQGHFVPYPTRSFCTQPTRSFCTLLYKVISFLALQGHFIPYPTRSFRTQPYKVVNSYPTIQGHSYITLQVHFCPSLQTHFFTIQCRFVPYHTRLFRTLPYQVVS